MSERHTLWLLLLVLAAQLLLLAVQVRGDTGATLLEQWTVRLVAPIPRFVGTITGSMEGLGEGMRRRQELEAETKRLNARIDELERQLFRLRNVEEERDRLAAALEYTPLVPGKLRPTQVVYLDHSSVLRTLILFCGGTPARLDQPVLTPDGLVGRVILVAGPYAKVQLLTDRAAAVSAVIERTRRQALVRGGTDNLELDFVPIQAPVAVGDRVITAGTDGVYPRGIPIGTVSRVRPGGELFREISIAPAVDFSHLDRVYLLDSEPVPQSLMETSPRARP